MSPDVADQVWVPLLRELAPDALGAVLFWLQSAKPLRGHKLIQVVAEEAAAGGEVRSSTFRNATAAGIEQARAESAEEGAVAAGLACLLGWTLALGRHATSLCLVAMLFGISVLAVIWFRKDDSHHQRRKRALTLAVTYLCITGVVKIYAAVGTTPVNHPESRSANQAGVQ
jgi:hypothetical protein